MDEELKRLEREYFQAAREAASAKGLRDTADILLLSRKKAEGIALDALRAHQDKMNESLLRDFHRHG